MKTTDRYISFGKHGHLWFTFYPYQLAFGISMGIFEGLRLRIYFLFFKIALNLTLL